jgi:hypothetical protein
MLPDSNVVNVFGLRLHIKKFIRKNETTSIVSSKVTNKLKLFKTVK